MTTKTIKPSRPEHTVAVTDALIERVLTEVRTARDLRIASSALREGAEQREDAGLDASAWRKAYAVAHKAGGGRPTRAGIRCVVASIRDTLGRA